MKPRLRESNGNTDELRVRRNETANTQRLTAGLAKVLVFATLFF
jgi:hypothetical protein